jgi:hypothetical protein
VISAQCVGAPSFDAGTGHHQVGRIDKSGYDAKVPGCGCNDPLNGLAAGNRRAISVESVVAVTDVALVERKIPAIEFGRNRVKLFAQRIDIPV